MNLDLLTDEEFEELLNAIDTRGNRTDPDSNGAHEERWHRELERWRRDRGMPSRDVRSG